MQDEEIADSSSEAHHNHLRLLLFTLQSGQNGSGLCTSFVG